MWFICNMGCGQSKHTYNENNNSTASIGLHSGSNGDARRSKNSKPDKFHNNINEQKMKENGKGHHHNSGNHCTETEGNSFKNFHKNGNRMHSKDKTGPTMPGLHITSSQVEFFRLLDEKIEQGEVLLKQGQSS